MAYWDYAESDNGRFLRHRAERSERCPNYGELHQGQPASPNREGVPKAWYETRVVRLLRCENGLGFGITDIGRVDDNFRLTATLEVCKYIGFRGEGRS